MPDKDSHDRLDHESNGRDETAGAPAWPSSLAVIFERPERSVCTTCGARGSMRRPAGEAKRSLLSGDG